MDIDFSFFSRYFLLQGGVNQQEWRAVQVWNDLLTIVQPQLAQPYQNLRDRLGRWELFFRLVSSRQLFTSVLAFYLPYFGSI